MGDTTPEHDLDSNNSSTRRDPHTERDRYYQSLTPDPEDIGFDAYVEKDKNEHQLQLNPINDDEILLDFLDRIEDTSTNDTHSNSECTNLSSSNSKMENRQDVIGQKMNSEIQPQPTPKHANEEWMNQIRLNWGPVLSTDEPSIVAPPPQLNATIFTEAECDIKRHLTSPKPSEETNKGEPVQSQPTSCDSNTEFEQIKDFDLKVVKPELRDNDDKFCNSANSTSTNELQPVDVSEKEKHVESTLQLNAFPVAVFDLPSSWDHNQMPPEAAEQLGKGVTVILCPVPVPSVSVVLVPPPPESSVISVSPQTKTSGKRKVDPDSSSSPSKTRVKTVDKSEWNEKDKLRFHFTHQLNPEDYKHKPKFFKTIKTCKRHYVYRSQQNELKKIGQEVVEKLNNSTKTELC